MEVASLELCRELYGLSGWEAYGYHYKVGYDMPTHDDRMGSNRMDNLCPAYDLGYLMRKLPPRLDTVPIIRYANNWLTVCKRQACWEARYGQNKHTNKAQTPEDAACRLAIELFKQGVLSSTDGNRPA